MPCRHNGWRWGRGDGDSGIVASPFREEHIHSERKVHRTPIAFNSRLRVPKSNQSALRNSAPVDIRWITAGPTLLTLHTRFRFLSAPLLQVTSFHTGYAFDQAIVNPEMLNL